MPKPSLLRTISLGGAAVALRLTATAPASGSATEGVSASRVALKPRWQELPSLEVGHGRALTDAAWSVGRAWFVVGGSKKLTMASARVRGRALMSFETTDVQAPLSWYPIVLGSDVLYSTGRKSSAVAPLLASGKLGPADAASPEPMESDVGVPRDRPHEAIEDTGDPRKEWK